MDDRHLTTLLERTYPSAPVPPLERLEQRAAAIRHRRRTLRAASAVAAAAIVVLAVVATLQGVDRRSIQTPLRPVPTATPDASKTHALLVTPRTGLRDRQIVRVSGRIAAKGVDVYMCRARVTPPTIGGDCDRTNGNAQGSTGLLSRYPFMVRRTITLGGQPVDCAAAPGCVLYAVSSGGDWLSRYGVAPIAFDPAAAPLPGPTVTVTPHDGLRDGDVVTIRGRHFRPFAPAVIAVCVDGTAVCDELGVSEWQLQAGHDGRFEVTHPVWSVLSSADGPVANCRSVTCAIGVESSPNVAVPLSFAPGSPASYPQLTLDPAGPYTDGQQVTVTVQGWPGSIGNRPGLAIDSLGVGQCGHVDGLVLCARATGQLILDGVGAGTETRLRGPEPDGRYTATLTLHRTLFTSSPGMGPFDCTQPGHCHVALALELNGQPPVHFIMILAVDVVVT